MHLSVQCSPEIQNACKITGSDWKVIHKHQSLKCLSTAFTSTKQEYFTSHNRPFIMEFQYIQVSQASPPTSLNALVLTIGIDLVIKVQSQIISKSSITA